MKKICFALIISLIFLTTVKASTGTVICTDDNEPLNVRESIGGRVLGGLACNSTVEVLNDNAGSDSSCTWYQVKQGNLLGYSCGTYIKINKDTKPNLKGKVSCVENDDPLGFRERLEGPTVDRLSCDTEMQILDTDVGSYGPCANWYKVTYENGRTGYVCGTYVITEVEVDYDDEDVKAYRTSLKNAGFPDSYLDDLVRLHVEHPTWNFLPFQTNLDWKTVIDNEAVRDRNLVYYTYGIGYRSLESYSYNWATDEYYRHPTETNWWYASREAIEYFMDPRNYLNSKNIFIFESLSYEDSFQTAEVVDKILGKSFMPALYSKYSQDPYTSAFIEAATKYDVSPVHLASRIVQEQGIGGSTASLGQNFSYGGNTYSGYFNFYNIRATGEHPEIQGLVWAMGGVNHNETSYGRPWDTPYKSILGGAKFLSEDYISIGQNTLYFQKFDVSRTSGKYTHQYMQNITAPLTEGVKTYTSYEEIEGLLGESLAFVIPIYNNMPEAKVDAPSDKSPNNYLNSIKIDNNVIDGFAYDKLEYRTEVASSKSSIDLTASSVNGNAKINGLGTKKLTNGENKFDIVVTAENGSKKTYTVIVNRQGKEEDIVLSGNNKLKNIIIEKIPFTFNPDTLEYNLTADFELSKITIKYELDDEKATANLPQEVDLIVGLNKINIIVSAENGEQKTYVLNITRKEIALDKALNNSGVKYNDKYIYGIDINTSIDSLSNNLKKVSTGLSTVIKDKDGKVKSGTFATGDKVTINNGSEEKTYEVLIYGDINGDAVIDKLDYLAILRHYYGYTKYEGVYSAAADVNRDGTIDKLDYLAVLRDYYGYAKIKQ